MNNAEEMFPKMRRIRQQLTDEETEEIFINGKSGVLSLNGTNGYPYSVPVSYVYCDGKIIFHGAKKGYKIECIENDSRASFCVIAKDEIVPEKYTTYFASAVAFGNVKILSDEKEKWDACDRLAAKYRPDFEEERKAEMTREWPATNVFVFEIEHMTGKQAIELVNREK